MATTEESISIFTSQPIAAVLVDHLLVGQDGFAAAKELRQQAEKYDPEAQLQITGMTGSMAIEDKKAYDLDGHLIKPFSADQLREVLEKKKNGNSG